MSTPYKEDALTIELTARSSRLPYAGITGLIGCMTHD